jgi:NAD(P)H-hydrate epimerase
MKSEIFTIDEKFVNEVIKPRKRDSHKGDNGIVAIIGGSWLYHGAPYLSALAALRSGVDLVYLAIPKQISIAIRALNPNLIVIPLPDAKLTKGCVNKLLKWLPEINSAVIGPGISKQKTDGIKELVKELIFRKVSLVLDAEALQQDVIEILKGKKIVITPHAGEFKRLFKIELNSNIENRIEIVKSKAKEYNFTILLKGAIDIISNGEKTAINKTGSPAMTVGGTGDVLSGLLAGILSHGINTFEAAAAAAYINGLAGEKATEKYGLHILATDIIDEIPIVMKKFDKIV